jgi:hypothetical protein
MRFPSIQEPVSWVLPLLPRKASRLLGIGLRPAAELIVAPEENSRPSPSTDDA